MLNEIFVSFLLHMVNIGELSRVSFYDDYANIDVIKDGKTYTLILRCEDKNDGNI